MSGAVQGGYRVIRAGELISIIEARKAGEITFTALRAYLGCHLLAASRMAAAGHATAASRATVADRATVPDRAAAAGRVRYTTKELRQRVGKDVSEEGIASALEQLERRGLLQFREEEIKFLAADRSQPSHGPHWSAWAELHTDPARPVPVPRFILRAIIRHRKPAEVLAALAHLIRCLWKKGKQIVSKGLVKASWVAALCGISERAVHSARRWMQEKKFLSCLEVTQHVLNRFGGCFVVSLIQEAGTAKRKVLPNSKRSRGAGGTAAAAGKEDGEFAPPLKKVLPLRSTSTTNQKDNPAFGGKPGFVSKTPAKPTLKHIQLDDLQRVSHLEELYKQATAAKWLPDCEASLRNFVAAAVRATRAGTARSRRTACSESTAEPHRPGGPQDLGWRGTVCHRLSTGGGQSWNNPVRIFVGIVRRGLWHHITQEQEDRATEVLKRYRDKQAAKCSKEVSSLLTELKRSLPMLPAGFEAKPGSYTAHH